MTENSQEEGAPGTQGPNIHERNKADYEAALKIIKENPERAALELVALKRRRTKFTELKSRLDEKIVQLGEAAYKDKTTGLYNKRWLEEFLPQFLEVAGDDTPLSVMFIDLDRFKQVNDTLGHAMGDKVLEKFSEVFKRQSDIPIKWDVRWGGDEFFMLLPDTDSDGANKLATNLLDEIKSGKDFEFLPQDVSKPGCSIGIASYRKGLTSQDLLGRADQALYAAKEQRGTVVSWSENLPPKPVVNSPK